MQGIGCAAANASQAKNAEVGQTQEDVPSVSVTQATFFACMRSMLWFRAGGLSFTQGTARSLAWGRKRDQNKGNTLKKRGGTAAPTTQERLLTSASTKMLMLLVLKEVCRALPLVCI